MIIKIYENDAADIFVVWHIKTVFVCNEHWVKIKLEWNKYKEHLIVKKTIRRAQLQHSLTVTLKIVLRAQVQQQKLMLTTR